MIIIHMVPTTLEDELLLAVASEVSLIINFTPKTSKIQLPKKMIPSQVFQAVIIMESKNMLFFLRGSHVPTFNTKTTPLPVMTTVKTKCFKQYLGGKLWMGGWKRIESLGR